MLDHVKERERQRAMTDRRESGELEALQAAGHLTKTALATQALRTAILRGEVRTDAPVTVGQIAQRLGMSQTPVREAIRTLQAEGLIRHHPHHTLSVVEYTAKDIHDIFQLRGDLEAQATRMAVPRLTEDDFVSLEERQQEIREASEHNDVDRVNRANSLWHLHMYGAADNQVLVDLVQHLWRKFMFEVNWMLPGHVEQSLRQHEAIMAALRARDADRAAALMREHIQAGEQSSLRFLEARQLRPRG
jgi:DNA-binding GntR family transcriptional regulator